MDNKLVFKPQTLTTYNWNRYQLNEDKNYNWDKYNVAPEYLHHYYWNKYSILRNNTYYIWKTYDSNDNYLGEIGSFNSGAYPQNGTETINGFQRKFVYDRQIDNNNNIYVWDEYYPVITYDKKEVYQPGISTFNVYTPNYLPLRTFVGNTGFTKTRFETYGGLNCNWVNEGNGSYVDGSDFGFRGTAATIGNVKDIQPYNEYGYIVNTRNEIYPMTGQEDGLSVHPYLCNRYSRKFHLTKDLPLTIKNNNATLPSLPPYYLKVKNTIEVDLDSFTQADLVDYIEQGYKYWIPDIDNLQTETKYGRGIFFELVNGYTYFLKNNSNGIILYNVVIRTTLAEGSIASLVSVIYPKFSCREVYKGTNYYSNGFILNATRCYQSAPSTGKGAFIQYDFYNTDFIYTPTELITRDSSYPVNEFLETGINGTNIKYYDLVRFTPEGERTIGSTLETIDSSEPLYPNEITEGYNYCYVVNTIHSLPTVSNWKGMGKFIGTTYTGTDDYTHLIYDGLNEYFIPYYNPITNTFFVYKSHEDSRYKHKWKKYSKGSNSSQVSTFQWYHYTWDMAILQIRDEVAELQDMYDNGFDELSILKQESNKLYISLSVGEWGDITERCKLISGLQSYIPLHQSVADLVKVNYTYYCSNSLPSFLPPANYPASPYNYHYIILNLDNNNQIIGGETYIFANDTTTPYNYPNVFIEDVYSLERNAYPDNGVEATFILDSPDWWLIPEGIGDYYIYEGQVPNDGARGDFIEKIESSTSGVYPNDGMSGDYWYVYQPNDYYKEVIRWLKQDKVGVVSALNNPNAYPTNGVWPNNFNEGYAHYYYIYTNYTSTYSQGGLIESISSYIETAYPHNSYIINDAWYIYTGTTTETTGELVIDKTKLMGGVNYKQEINPSEDLQIGTAGAAQVDFTIFSPDAAAAIQYLGKDFTYYVKMNSDSDWRQIGVFVLTTAELPDKQTAKIQGYDYIYKFDTVVDEWIDELTFPISLGDFFASLCEYVGCEAYSTSFVNSDFMVNDNFEAVNITGRTILQYITELSGGFCVAEPTGRIQIKNYSIPSSGAINLGSGDFVKYTHEIYSTPMITSVVVRKDEDDEGVESNV